MAKIKEQHMALSSGVGLAGHAVTNFWEFKDEIFDCYKEEMIDSAFKPKKFTAVHYLLEFFQDFYEDFSHLESVDAYEYAERTLNEVNLYPELPKPNFEKCGDEHGHHDCECADIIEQWVDYSKKHASKIDELVVHSAFQFVFQDRKFLHDFHLEFSKVVEQRLDYIQEHYSQYLTQKGRLKRQNFPEWLKSAVFHRDKGTCVICRCDLSNLIRQQNQINIDHIIPLKVYGTNDTSNMQLLCSTCNQSKGDRTTETSSINVPFWNME
ncbi:HNH endonuclease [Halobacillus trueperi]|uniref:HNH endonuclease n=1 Tax=Halobacillus trueperi TaxID=156205 RepID=A0A3D8VTH0_9BACI|nr:HNH endonuclease [Halobacillus trueperi]RDY72557.1 HNH endonuclease [Halobacillus trueperi]